MDEFTDIKNLPPAKTPPADVPFAHKVASAAGIAFFKSNSPKTTSFTEEPEPVVPALPKPNEFDAPAITPDLSQSPADKLKEEKAATSQANSRMEAEQKAAQAPQNPNAPQQPKEQTTLRAIRTYQADVAEQVKSKNTSLVHMVIAEQKRKQDVAEVESPKSKLNVIFIAASFVLLLAGTITAVVVYNKFSQSGTVAPQKTKTPSLLFAENEKHFSITDLNEGALGKSIGAEVTNANNKLDTIENFTFSETVGGADVLLTTQRLFFFLDNRMPPILLRSLDKDFMLGVHTFNGNQPFLVFHTNFYENTFAGMLEWEQYMARDLFPVFGIQINADSPVFLRPFEDETIKNRDTRALKDDGGKIILFYTFKDKQTLIITTSSDTLEEVIRRLNSSNPIAR